MIRAMINELRRYPILVLLPAGFVLGLFLYLIRDYGFALNITLDYGFIPSITHDYGCARFLVVTIIAFLASDVLSVLFVRGGNGILQIPLIGEKAQPKLYGFVAFFISIVVVALVINAVTSPSVELLTQSFSNFTVCIVAGLILAALVYLDMYAKFYAHK